MTQGLEVPRQGRRQTEAFRNLDDTLKICGVLSIKSFGLLLILFALLHGLQLLPILQPICEWLFAGQGFLVTLILTIAAGVGLSWAERQDDEHLVPSAINYYLAQPWRTLYRAGLRPSPPAQTILDLLER